MLLLSGHSNYISVSGSHDHTIRVWNASTGILAMAPLAGHSEEVTSVAFSPDGTRIVSCSDDCTIHVGDAFTGNLAMSPLEGHSSSVVFSPDGSHIVSGSDALHYPLIGYIHWKPRNGHFRGALQRRYLCCLLARRTHIVSGSADRMIRVWDTTSEHQ
ncbi:hypothetical protein HGRIS_011987 [Hohenbuehelia grisea]|uniref:WD40 repeat-like protein n=1 Tax=Hohenbuehelia grisea TaxID=104357 RepID=A0ABR3JWQ8_9AGAR